jgi:SAM-dependent methyltransferase
MNELHLQFLASPEWARMLETDLLPWVLSVGDLGDDVLEVGPGPGLTTDLLRRQTSKLTVVEIDAELAASLATRLSGTNVDVIHGDATDTGFAPGRFSSATCFSMLHHIPHPETQDRLFAEVYRILRPRGIFAGVDSIDSEPIREFHAGDVFVPVDPMTLRSRLEAAGFTDVNIEPAGYQVRFSATKLGAAT